jgi:hypothetical protein
VASVDKPADCRRVCFSGARAKFTASARNSSRYRERRECGRQCRMAPLARPRLVTVFERAVPSVIEPNRHVRVHGSQYRSCPRRKGSAVRTHACVPQARRARRWRSTAAQRQEDVWTLFTADGLNLTLQFCKVHHVIAHGGSLNVLRTRVSCPRRIWSRSLCWSPARAPGSLSEHRRHSQRRYFQCVADVPGGLFPIWPASLPAAPRLRLRARQATTVSPAFSPD